MSVEKLNTPLTAQIFVRTLWEGYRGLAHITLFLFQFDSINVRFTSRNTPRSGFVWVRSLMQGSKKLADLGSSNMFICVWVSVVCRWKCLCMNKKNCVHYVCEAACMGVHTHHSLTLWTVWSVIVVKILLDQTPALIPFLTLARVMLYISMTAHTAKQLQRCNGTTHVWNKAVRFTSSNHLTVRVASKFQISYMNVSPCTF